MQLRPTLRLQAAIEAMTHIVIPALDENDQLAQEQAQLVVGMLSNTLEWLPLEYAYARAELTCLLDAAEEMRTTPGNATISRSLDDVVGRGQEALRQTAVAPRKINEAVRELRTALGACATGAFATGSQQDQQAVGKAILAAAARQEPYLRAAYLGHGFEGDAPDLPSLAQQLEGLL